VVKSTSGSDCATNVAPSDTYSLHPSQPAAASQASKNFFATSNALIGHLLLVSQNTYPYILLYDSENSHARIGRKICLWVHDVHDRAVDCSSDGSEGHAFFYFYV